MSARERVPTPPAITDRAPYLLGLVTRGVLHDLASLTGSVLGNVQLAQRALAETNGEVAQWLSDAEAATRKIDELRRGLLALASGEQTAPEILDLNDLVLATTPLLQRLLGARIRIVTRCAPLLPLISATPNHLTRVLFNLVINARDAIGSELDDHGTIVISTAAADGAALLSITDDGCGMPPEVLGRLFEPYYTTKGEGGTGLGLIACRWLLEQDGGTIAVESMVGRGTTVEVRLLAA